MWSELVKSLPAFPTAVLTIVGADGYPFSLRCEPQIDEAKQVLRLYLSDPGAQFVRSGAATLLYHSHNQLLWDLKYIQITGQIEQTDDHWTFQPEKFTPGGSFVGQWDQMRSLFKASADARRYLQKHQLQRPKVRWDEFRAVIAEARKFWPAGEK